MRRWEGGGRDGRSRREVRVWKREGRAEEREGQGGGQEMALRGEGGVSTEV